MNERMMMIIIIARASECLVRNDYCGPSTSVVVIFFFFNAVAYVSRPSRSVCNVYGVRYF